ncbi:S-(hydroxymethyl)glutathione dehydrogenase-like protein 2 [Elsinoe australis]|uniref:S-(Hydroxymethyl)glutathione dehydrogenase-like protein 2 n=1 Tax=Elsinoe australis TaxID=40998 RepID=A0A4U7AVR7_9PEZI|nr:S-(hydroxymethyl)glutathione dehydrogenase-like protein 2 [Elsinoe australis]
MPFETEAYTVHEAGGPIRLEKVQIDDVRDGEVLIETVAFSVCATDLKAAAGKFLLKPPMILGHEASGIVRQAPGSKTNLKPGTKVILSFSHCGSCATCADGAPAYCHNLSPLNFSGRRSDGSSAICDGHGKELNHFFFGQSSMGRHILARETSVVALPDETPIEDLRKFAALGCGIQTGAGAILNVCRPSPGASIAIIGAGAVGLSAALAALTLSPAHIILIDTSASKLALAPASLRPTSTSPSPSSGARITHIDSSSLPAPSASTSAPAGPASPAQDPLTTALRSAAQATGKTGVDFILDCVGHPSLIEAAIPALAARGTVVTVGGGAPGAEAKVKLMDMLIGGRTWRGTHQGDSDGGPFLRRLIRMEREGVWGFGELVGQYGFLDGGEGGDGKEGPGGGLGRALEDLKEGRVVKAVVVVK